MPEYRIVNGRIRVLHLDLMDSWWNRGNSPWERHVKEFENVVRQATGLHRVTKIHGRHYVEFRIRDDLAAQANVAVVMQFGPQSESILLKGHNAENNRAHAGP